MAKSKLQHTKEGYIKIEGDMLTLFNTPWPETTEALPSDDLTRFPDEVKKTESTTFDELPFVEEKKEDASKKTREDMEESFLSKDDEAICRVVSNSMTRKQEVLLARSQDAELLIQPKSLTFGGYPLSITQQDILVDIVSYIQSYMTNDMSVINPKLLGLINVPLRAGNYPAYGKHYGDFHNDLEKIWQHGKISFAWKEEMINSPAAKRMFVDKEGKTLFGPNSKVSTSVSLISGITTDSTQPDLQVITLNPLALPFLLYYGKGVGGTRYQKQIMFKLQKKYAKRLYPILMDYTTTPDRPHKMPLDVFRDTFEIPSCYDNSRVFTQILKPAMEEINSAQDEYVFSSELITENYANNGKKPKLDTVKFNIEYKKDFRNVHHVHRQGLVLIMQEFADRGMNDAIEQAADLIFERGKYELFSSKVQYYHEQLHNRQIKSQDYKNIMLSIVLKMTGIDLRTLQHIRNAKNYKARVERANKIKSIGNL